MVVISSLQTNLHHNQFSNNTHHNTNIYTITCKPISPNLIYFHNLIKNFSKTSSSTSNRNFTIKAYIEDSNSFSNFANKVIGSLPVIGLIARIVNGEGGVGSDFIDFAEFRRRVGNKCSVNDSKAFYDFQVRHGKAGEPLYVLLCCWLAAVGAGLLKSEEILEGVARLRISDDIEFEEQTFIQIMNEAREKREKLRSPNPKIPMNIRVEKALDAIYVCSFGRDPIEDEDIELLTVMLIAVFPTVGASEIQRIIKEKAQRIADGTEVFSPEAKPLPKEAALLQMKDLEFLQQKKEK